MSTDQAEYSDEQTGEQSDDRRLDDLCQNIIERDETPEELEEVCRALKHAVEEGRIDAT